MRGNDTISAIDVLFISIPEAIVIYLLANSFISTKLEFKKILKLSVIYGILCYFIKSMLHGGVVTGIIALLSATLYLFSAKINFINGFILFAVIYGIRFITEFVVLSLATTIGITIDMILGDPILKYVFFYITLAISLIIIYLNTKRNMNLLNLPIKRNIKIDKNKSIIYTLIIIGSANIFLLGVSFLNKNLNNYELFSVHELIFYTSVIASVISLIIIILNQESKKDIVLIEQSLMVNNLKQMEETIDLLRIQKHDVMNHLQIILMQINGGKSEDAKRYILGLAEDVKNIGIVFDTGNNYIDAILNFKNRKCMDAHIELTACIDSLLENTRLDDTQLSSIFLNIIDNAIDELKKCRKEYKYIHVDTYCEDNKHIISIKNNASKIEDTQKIFEMGVSSKGINRGYGLFSIKQLLLRNKSDIYVVSDDDETEFIIEIPIGKKELEMLIDT